METSEVLSDATPNQPTMAEPLSDEDMSKLKTCLNELSGLKLNEWMIENSDDEQQSICYWPNELKMTRKAVNRMKKSTVEKTIEKKTLLLSREKKLVHQLLRCRLEILHLNKTVNEVLFGPENGKSSSKRSVRNKKDNQIQSKKRKSTESSEEKKVKLDKNKESENKNENTEPALKKTKTVKNSKEEKTMEKQAKTENTNKNKKSKEDSIVKSKDFAQNLEDICENSGDESD